MVNSVNQLSLGGLFDEIDKFGSTWQLAKDRRFTQVKVGQLCATQTA